MITPPRVPWNNFPDAVILRSEPETKSHPDYPPAKSGDAEAAARLVIDLLDDDALTRIQTLIPQRSTPIFAAATAYERGGYNAIPATLAAVLGEYLALPFEHRLVQSNIVLHTGSGGFARLAHQAAFAGTVTPNREYILVDDFVGQGGTLASFRGWIEANGGTALGAIVLAGKEYSAQLTPTEDQLNDLRHKHGSDLEEWWQDLFGHSFDCLTHSEARYLTRGKTADAVRVRVTAAMREGDR